MWERYCRGVNAIVYMVDAADQDKIEVNNITLSLVTMMTIITTTYINLLNIFTMSFKTMLMSLMSGESQRAAQHQCVIIMPMITTIFNKPRNIFTKKRENFKTLLMSLMSGESQRAAQPSWTATAGGNSNSGDFVFRCWCWWWPKKTMTMTMTMTTWSQVLGNKRDLPGALDETGLIERMGLSAVQVVIVFTWTNIDIYERCPKIKSNRFFLGFCFPTPPHCHIDTIYISMIMIDTPGPRDLLLLHKLQRKGQHRYHTAGNDDPAEHNMSHDMAVLRETGVVPMYKTKH